MALLNRQDSANVPPELAPYYTSGSRGGRVLGAILRFVVVVVIAFLLAVFVRWGWHKIHHASTTKAGVSQSQNKGSSSKPSTSQPATTQPETGTSSSGSSSATTTNPSTGTSLPSDDSSTGSTAQTGQTATPPASSTPAASGSTQTTNAIPNTGPGDTVLMFIGTVVVAAALHQFYVRRKLSE